MDRDSILFEKENRSLILRRFFAVELEVANGAFRICIDDETFIGAGEVWYVRNKKRLRRLNKRKKNDRKTIEELNSFVSLRTLEQKLEEASRSVEGVLFD